MLMLKKGERFLFPLHQSKAMYIRTLVSAIASELTHFQKVQSFSWRKQLPSFPPKDPMVVTIWCSRTPEQFQTLVSTLWSLGPLSQSKKPPGGLGFNFYLGNLTQSRIEWINNGHTYLFTTMQVNATMPEHGVNLIYDVDGQTCHLCVQYDFISSSFFCTLLKFARVACLWKNLMSSPKSLFLPSIC